MIHIGFIVAVTALIVCSLVMGAGAISGAITLKAGMFDEAIGSAIVSVCALLIGAAILWGIYPFDMEYHKYVRISGTVSAVTPRLYNQTDNYVVTIGGQYYRCDDSRCATLHEGNHVSLLCSRVWQYASENGWVCNYNGR